MSHISFLYLLMMFVYWVKYHEENTEALLIANKKVYLEVNIEKTKYIFMCHLQTVQVSFYLKGS
jgi:hypothetical protein